MEKLKTKILELLKARQKNGVRKNKDASGIVFFLVKKSPPEFWLCLWGKMKEEKKNGHPQTILEA